jgi:hypothetical protein
MNHPPSTGLTNRSYGTLKVFANERFVSGAGTVIRVGSFFAFTQARANILAMQRAAEIDGTPFFTNDVQAITLFPDPEGGDAISVTVPANTIISTSTQAEADEDALLEAYAIATEGLSRAYTITFDACSLGFKRFLAFDPSIEVSASMEPRIFVGHLNGDSFRYIALARDTSTTAPLDLAFYALKDREASSEDGPYVLYFDA